MPVAGLPAQRELILPLYARMSNEDVRAAVGTLRQSLEYPTGEVLPT